MFKHDSLKGRVAVVTGGGGVLCGGFAKDLARQGVKVAILDLRLEAAQKVADEIKAEINRLKEEGLNKKLFTAIRSGLYGNAIRGFNNIENIAMGLVDCAMNDTDLFDDVKYLKAITVDDVYKRLARLDDDKTVLSVIVPKEK